MGYETKYQLDFTPQSHDVIEFLENDIDFLVDVWRGKADRCKWYGHEKEIK